ncbi:MAG: VanZ family protein [Pseudobutyrivibrio sp.]|nr:VanZ family protein [Pseudobutyrivibrio sp.]
MELNSFYDLYANNWVTNIIIVAGATLLAVLLVYLLPYFDNRICNKLGLNLQGGISENKNSGRTAYVRRIILIVAFILYIFFLVYVVLLARTANPDYVVRNAGFSLFTMTWQDIELPQEEFIEFYLNVMVFVPMGYLLPYIFRWFRNHALGRTLLVCFLSSILIENLQLITKRGTYDTADVIADTLGGLIGIIFFLQRAYNLTNPHWRRDFKYYRRWKKLHKDGQLYPFAKKMYIGRVTILATDEEAVWEFYSLKLGFQLKEIIVPEDSNETWFLFGMGKFQIEVRCLNRGMDLPKQEIMLAHHNLDSIKYRLDNAGHVVSEFGMDPYTNHRTLILKGPDDVTIKFIEL